jgi:conjugative transfer region protein (TIGR03750 family)
MSEQQHVRADGTVTFLPHRLNRHPVVVRGLTADELWICCGLSGAAGLLVGAPLSWVFRTIAMAPTFVVLGVAWACSSAAASCAASSAGAPTPGCTGNCNGASPRAIR